MTYFGINNPDCQIFLSEQLIHKILREYLNEKGGDYKRDGRWEFCNKVEGNKVTTTVMGISFSC